MLDGALRRYIDPPLDALARPLAAAGLSANAVTLGGFAIGLAAIPLLSIGAYNGALLAILANRLADGLDGAIARRKGPSDRGAYLDIVCDFIFYGAVVFGFVLALPENRLPGAFLLISFIGTGSSFLAFAALAARRGMEILQLTQARGLMIGRGAIRNRQRLSAGGRTGASGGRSEGAGTKHRRRGEDPQRQRSRIART